MDGPRVPELHLVSTTGFSRVRYGAVSDLRRRARCGAVRLGAGDRLRGRSPAVRHGVEFRTGCRVHRARIPARAGVDAASRARGDVRGQRGGIRAAFAVAAAHAQPDDKARASAAAPDRDRDDDQPDQQARQQRVATRRALSAHRRARQRDAARSACVDCDLAARQPGPREHGRSHSVTRGEAADGSARTAWSLD